MFNARSLPVALVAAVLLGIPAVTVIIALQTWLQRTTPAALLGRVSAVFITAEAAASMVGALAGPALSVFGLPIALNAACTVAAGAAVLTFFLVPGPWPTASITCRSGASRRSPPGAVMRRSWVSAGARKRAFISRQVTNRRPGCCPEPVISNTS